MYFVYILQSKFTGYYYIGVTNNIIRRFKQHQSGHSRSTRKRGPWWMPYYEIYDTRKEALMREREIKNKKSAQYIKRMIARANGT
jgi:putative endonuclease